MNRKRRRIEGFIKLYQRENPSGNFFDRDRLKREKIRLSEVTIYEGTVMVSGKECYKISVLQGGRGTGRRFVYFDCVTMQEIEGEEESRLGVFKGYCFSGATRVLNYNVILDGVPCCVVSVVKPGGTIYAYFTEEGYKFVCEKPAVKAELPPSPLLLRVGQRIELSGHYMDSYNGRFRVMRESGDGGYIINRENANGRLATVGDKTDHGIRAYKRSAFYDPAEEKKIRAGMRYFPDEKRWPYAKMEGEPVKSERVYEYDKENSKIKIL